MRPFLFPQSGTQLPTAGADNHGGSHHPLYLRGVQCCIV
jgi:hypothetical protein